MTAELNSVAKTYKLPTILESFPKGIQCLTGTNRIALIKETNSDQLFKSYLSIYIALEFQTCSPSI